MPELERKISEEHDALNPPVVPCFFRTKTLTGPITQGGWEGYKIVPKEDGGWKVRKEPAFMLTILADGYCEIPATKANLAKLEILMQPLVVHKVKFTEVLDEEGKTVKVPVRDENGRPVYTDEIERTEPPAFRKAARVRTFDPKKDSVVDMVRPWLRQFVSVPGAVLEEEEA